MNATAIPEAMTAPRGRDLRDARADRLFKLALAATVVFVLLALGSAALSMLWGGRHALQMQGLSFSIPPTGIRWKTNTVRWRRSTAPWSPR